MKSTKATKATAAQEPKEKSVVKVATDKLPATVDVETLAATLGIDPRRVQQLRKEGVIPSAGRGRYDLVASVQAYIKYWRDRAEGRSQDSGKDPKRSDWMTRKIAADAEKVEYQVAEQKRTLVHVNYMRDQVAHILTALRGALLSRASRLAQTIGSCENVTERELMLEEDDRRTMEALQQIGDNEQMLDDEDAAA